MIARWLLAGILLAAGVLKLGDPGAFADGLEGFHLLPLPLVVPLALAVPLFEILTAAALLGGRFRSAGSLSACLLTAAFVVFYAWAVVRGIDVHCACFGRSPLFRVSATGGLLRAAALLGLALWVDARLRIKPPALRRNGSGER